VNFLTRLFDTSDFPARWHCGRWTSGHGWLHILSDLGVWSAYLAIPLVLGYFIVRKKDLPFRKMFLLFGAFILACGTTHLMEAIIFWWPAYRLAGVIKLFTAIVSWATVFALVPIVPKVLAMRSPEELEREIAGAAGAGPHAGVDAGRYGTAGRTRTAPHHAGEHRRWCDCDRCLKSSDLSERRRRIAHRMDHRRSQGRTAGQSIQHRQ
jgi:hypothetical protein